LRQAVTVARAALARIARKASNYRVDQVAPFILLMPIIGVLLAFLFLNEQPSALVLCGGVAILAGLGLVVRAPKEISLQAA
jgi:O-acetylserine/cysteine efflux transporter